MECHLFSYFNQDFLVSEGYMDTSDFKGKYALGRLKIYHLKSTVDDFNLYIMTILGSDSVYVFNKGKEFLELLKSNVIFEHYEIEQYKIYSKNNAFFINARLTNGNHIEGMIVNGYEYRTTFKVIDGQKNEVKVIVDKNHTTPFPSFLKLHEVQNLTDIRIDLKFKVDLASGQSDKRLDQFLKKNARRKKRNKVTSIIGNVLAALLFIGGLSFIIYMLWFHEF